VRTTDIKSKAEGLAQRVLVSHRPLVSRRRWLVIDPAGRGGKGQAAQRGCEYHHVLGLPSDPPAHVDVAVRRTSSRRIHIEAHARVTTLACSAAAASDVERHAAHGTIGVWHKGGARQTGEG
jgi:hypothetical protein